MDDADIAQAATEVLESAALKAHFTRTDTMRAGRIQGLHLEGAGPSSRLCADCEMAIPQERIKANPSATRCVKCQTKYELKTRRSSDER